MLSQPQGQRVAGMIRSTEKSNNLIGNQTHNFPAYRIVPEPTMLPCALPPAKKNSRVTDIFIVYTMGHV
jgi:hypothetical protein